MDIISSLSSSGLMLNCMAFANASVSTQKALRMLPASFLMASVIFAWI